MSASPHANGGELLRPLRLPDFSRAGRVECRSPGASTAAATSVLGHWVREVVGANPRTFRLVGPDEVASNRLQAVFEVTDRPVRRRDAGPPTSICAARGRVLEVLSEHLCRGLAGGLPAHRPARDLHLLRGVHPHRRLDGQPARQVDQGEPVDPVAAPDRVAELPAHQPRVAAGPQRLLPPGPRLHRPCGEQEVRDRARLPAPGREHAAVHDGPLPAQPGLRSTSWWRASSPRPQWLDRDAAVAHCAAGHRHLGLGVQRRRRRAGRGARLLRRRADRGDPRRGDAAAPAPAAAAGAGGERGRPDAAAGPDRAPARAVRPGVRPAVPAGLPGDLRIPRLPVVDPPAHLPPAQPPRTSTCAATRRRAPPPRRSTC